MSKLKSSRKMQDNIFLGLGSNLGNRRENLFLALAELENDKYIFVEKISTIYETKPIGLEKQNNFYNCVVKIQSFYKPYELLETLKEIEKKLGREETIKWGPRIIDIDIIFYNDVLIDDENLSIPHKEFDKRDFFIIPMKELDENFINPKNRIVIKNIMVDENNLTILEKVM
ncbi:MAG: 2-amino-4-hydroxy-6-hydroxymethyldihydropteridine diphosphokinase [Ignavibacteriales bacterium]|nr:2-amino-4-hydroxy-6-hydroxymethyldihydropteridine diphosphokinase [Ignavibacteriales bacterium]